MKRPVFSIFAWVALLGFAIQAQATSIHIIRSAIEDGLYEQAERQIWEALSVERTPAEKTDLTILLVRALTGRKNFEHAITLCDESQELLLQDAFRYWKANAQFEAGQISAAFQTLENFPPKSPYLSAALRLQGRAAVSNGDLKIAESIFSRFDKQFPAHENAAQNLLDLAHVCRERGRGKSAQKALDNLLERFPDTVEADTGRMMLAHELIADGKSKAQKQAAELLRQLGSTESAHPRMRIAAWVELSGIEQAAGRTEAAIEALRTAETFTEETVLRIRQQAARATLLFEKGDTEEALALFDAAARIAPDQETAAAVLIQKAEALLEYKQFSKAETAFQSCLNVTEQTPIQRRALSGKGWSLWHQNRFEEAAAYFEKAVSKCSSADELITAYIKAGDARLKAKQFDKAHDNYRKASETDLHHPLAPQAAYQSAIALLSNGNTDKAFRYFQTVESSFPESEFARQAALKRADILQRKGNLEGALEEHIYIAEQYTNAALRAASIHQQGLILFELNRYEDALSAFDSLLKAYPESEEAPQAFYMRGFCRYLQGHVEEALDILRLFIEKYPDSNWTPEVLFLLSENAYNQGDYPQAHESFLQITEHFPQNELADDALFWAGNALLKQDNFLDAFTLYSRLAGNYPQSDLLMQTRFAQGEALTELGEFARAILAYEEIIKSEPDTLLAARARGRRGDCLFTLGASEPERYDEALATYHALERKNDLPFDLKLQTLCKIARCKDKTGNPAEALEHYTEAVYSIGEHSEPLSPTAVLWFTRAALEAGDLLERKQQWREAVRIYERIIQANVPAGNEAKKRIEKIQREHAEKF